MPSETCAAMQSMSVRQAELERIETDGADGEREREPEGHDVTPMPSRKRERERDRERERERERESGLRHFGSSAAPFALGPVPPHCAGGEVGG